MIEKVKLIGIGAVSGICLSYSLYYYIQRYCTKNKKREAPKYLGLSSLYNNSPLIRLDSLSKEYGCDILAKVEFLSIGGSSKDRIALSIINQAEKDNLIKPNASILEGTVGSTGISLAIISRIKGYTCHIIMPDDQSLEKYALLEKLGAIVEKVRPSPIVSPDHFVNIARTRAEEMNKAVPGSAFFVDQFENKANFDAHFTTTGVEIYEQTDGVLDAFVMGAGTGGTIGGVSSFLKSKIEKLKVVLADPMGSGLYNRVKHGVMYSPFEKEGSRTRHQVDTIVEGMGQTRRTANIDRLFNEGLVDDAVRVEDIEAVEMSRYMVREEGLFLGSSSCVNLVAAVRVAKALGPGHTILTMLCDGGQRHLTKFWNDEYLEKAGLTPSAVGLEFLK